jgi:hypothetical protein
VTRHGRLGTVIEEAKAPQNAELSPARLEEIHRAFAAVGITRYGAIEAIEHAARARVLRRLGMRRRCRRAADFEEMYEDFAAFEAAQA